MNNKLIVGQRLFAALALGTLLYSCQPQIDLAPEQTGQARVAAQGDYVDGELLIQFKEGASDGDKQKALDKVQGKSAEKIFTKAMEKAGKKEGLLLVKVNKNVLEAIADLQGASGVEFAEPNFIYTHTAVSTDPYFTDGTLWGMKAGFGSNAEAAWANRNIGLASVFVGIIDEGIQFNHTDLSGQVWTNPGEIAGDKIDNDQNGYIDDINGWDFANNDATIYDGGTRGSSDDHGTHVAGTIGGKANTVGVVGVNWNIRLISAKFLGRNGGTLANAVKAVDYLTYFRENKGINIVASNNSWGGGGFSQSLLDAINRANAKEILFVAAAGNSGTNNDATPSYPSSYTAANVIAVAAIDRNGGLASFSQFGATSVDLGAPGVSVMSTTAFNLYSSYDGTSMATPHVTGAVALYAATKPNSSAATIKNAILSSIVSTTSLIGKTATGGRLDANAALSK